VSHVREPVRKAAAFTAVAAGYGLMIAILLAIVLSLTTALSDGWALRQSAHRTRDGSPRFSPDGQLIAFLRRGDDPTSVWVVSDVDDAPLRLAQATRFVWTPEGTLLISRGGPRVFRVATDGGAPVPAGRRRLPPGRDRAAAPDGRVVFVRDHHLFVRAPDGSVERLT
jgi:hypothetical protein